jgi:raffinose/stachyose/melibiose transport system permease protein
MRVHQEINANVTAQAAMGKAPTFKLAKIVGVPTIWIVLVGYVVAIAYPLYWMIINSFKNSADIFNHSGSLPKVWLIENYKQAWEQGVSSYFMNSVFITVVTCLITILVSALCAYGLSRFQMRGQKYLLLFVSAGLMFSPQVSLIPLYDLIQTLGLYNTYWALILPYVAYRIPLTVLLIRSYFLSIPKELEESATLDGCSSFGIFFRIFLPISRPILLTAFILTAYFAWNEFLFSLIFIQDDAIKPVTSGLLVFRDALNTNWGVLLAGLTISALPLIVIFIFIQKYFVRGLAEGGVKG